MLDRRELRRDTSDTASERCLFCSQRISPGEEITTLQAVRIHGSCYDREEQRKPDTTKLDHD